MTPAAALALCLSSARAVAAALRAALGDHSIMGGDLSAVTVQKTEGHA